MFKIIAEETAVQCIRKKEHNTKYTNLQIARYGNVAYGLPTEIRT
jgi:hypothetical protein